MNKKLGETVDTTLEMKDVEEMTSGIFNRNNGHSLPSGEVRPVTISEQPRNHRPRVELPHDDYQKLKMICVSVNEDISKMLYKVVKTWLDSVEVKL